MKNTLGTTVGVRTRETRIEQRVRVSFFQVLDHDHTCQFSAVLALTMDYSCSVNAPFTKGLKPLLVATACRGVSNVLMRPHPAKAHNSTKTFMETCADFVKWPI